MLPGTQIEAVHAWTRGAKHLERQRDGAPRVMLLTSGLGTGHVRAAQAVEVALRSRAPGCTISTIDFWSLIDADVTRAIQRTYLRLVSDHPDLYHRLYQLDQHSWRGILEQGEAMPSIVHELGDLIEPVNAMQSVPLQERFLLDRLLYRQLTAILAGQRSWNLPMSERWQQAVVRRSWHLLAKRLRRRIERFAPDVLVATQVNMAALAAALKSKRHIDMPLIGVVTDYGVHDFWLQEHIDVYCVADEAVSQQLRRVTNRPVRIEVSGIPLMPGFTRPPSQVDARRALGLPQHVPVVLVLGGGLGLGIDDVVQRLARERQTGTCTGVTNLHILVLAGRNARLRATLQATVSQVAPDVRVSVHEWTDQVATFARAADLVVGKPGGLTVAEMLACGRPIFSTCSLRGQESFNVAFLEYHGLGGLVTEEQLAQKVADVLHSTDLNGIQDRAWQIGKRHGADHLAELICEEVVYAQVPGELESSFS